MILLIRQFYLLYQTIKFNIDNIKNIIRKQNIAVEEQSTDIHSLLFELKNDLMSKQAGKQYILKLFITNIAHWIRNLLRRTSKVNNEYNYLNSSSYSIEKICFQ